MTGIICDYVKHHGSETFVFVLSSPLTFGTMLNVMVLNIKSINVHSDYSFGTILIMIVLKCLEIKPLMSFSFGTMLNMIVLY